jgi:ABC-type multidrug transport system ATPase subunit
LLADADLQLAAGEIAALAGPSGSGKSTLAELIAYGHAPGVDGLRGDIVLDRDHCVHLMQFGALLDHLSVGANLRLVARYTGSGRSTRESLELLGLPASLATRPVASLSGGEYRRVAIARALLKEPRVLLLDEPDAGLDLPALRDLAGLLRAQAQEQQRAILILTHNPNLAAWAADRLLLLTAGRLQEVPVEHSERGFLAVEQRLEEALAPRITRRSATAGFLGGLARTLACLVRPSPSGKDYLAVLGRTLRLSFLSALPFFVLVGFMFGATTIAALEVMRSQTLSGFLATIVTPRLVVETIRGSYVAYLAPAVGALLFAARSGSVLSGWLSSLAAGGPARRWGGPGPLPAGAGHGGPGSGRGPVPADHRGFHLGGLGGHGHRWPGGPGRRRTDDRGSGMAAAFPGLAETGAIPAAGGVAGNGDWHGAATG